MHNVYEKFSFEKKNIDTLELYKIFLDCIFEALQSNNAKFPKQNSKMTFKPPKWWDNDCNEAVNNRRKHLNDFKSNPTRNN